MAILPPSRDTHHTNCNIIPCEFPSFTQPHTKHITMLQDQHKFDFSGTRSHPLDSLSGIRQEEEILSQKQDPTAYGGKIQAQISQQYQKKGKRVNVGCDYERRIRPPWEQGRSHHQQTGSRGSSYSGTGVFFPRGETSAPLESPKRPDKGCSTTVLIPARVVQALQVHFHQMAATCPAFSPLHDVLVRTRDGMYSLQNRRSHNQQPHMQNEMLLPQEWTY